MSLVHLILLLVALQRLAELAYARRNEARLRARGGIEFGARHYPLFFAVHGGWLAAMAVLTPPDAPISWLLIAVFALLQVARIWVVASLGAYWTARIISVPDAPLVRRGPYRWLRHPNYWIVIGEIAVLPAAFGDWAVAAAFSLANAILLWHRIGVENAALERRRGIPA
jgi:methyltransferase